MPQSYAVLDNGSGSSKRPPKAQRQYVKKYLASKGMTASGPGMRSKKEKKLRAEARAAYRASKASKSSSSSKSTSSTSPKKTDSYVAPKGLTGAEARQAKADARTNALRGAGQFRGRAGEARQAKADAMRTKKYRPSKKGPR